MFLRSLRSTLPFKKLQNSLTIGNSVQTRFPRYDEVPARFFESTVDDSLLSMLLTTGGKIKSPRNVDTIHVTSCQ